MINSYDHVSQNNVKFNNTLRMPIEGSHDATEKRGKGSPVISSLQSDDRDLLNWVSKVVHQNIPDYSRYMLIKTLYNALI